MLDCEDERLLGIIIGFDGDGFKKLVDEYIPVYEDRSEGRSHFGTFGYGF